MEKANFFATEKLVSKREEIFEILLSRPGCTIERILSNGKVTPDDKWFEQKDEEWVLLLEGFATILFEEGMEEISLSKGDFITIPPMKRHKVISVSKTPNALWLAIHIST